MYIYSKSTHNKSVNKKGGKTMKPCCVCVLVGVAIGMFAGCFLMVSNKKFKQMVKSGKSTIEEKVQEIKSNMEDQ